MARPLRTRSSLTPSTLVEHPPSRQVAGATVCTWDGDPAGPRELRVLPDGSADLVWDGSRLRVAGAGAVAATHVVAAPTAGLRLRIGAAGGVLGVPAHELAPDGVELVAVWGERAACWERRLQDAADAAAARAVLEGLVAERLAITTVDRAVRAAVALVATGHTVDDVARRTGCSARDLRRRFHREVGIGPKTLQRVVRFDRFVAELGALAAGGTSLAALAPALGFADQAHLTRECQEIAGTTPARLVARWSRHDREPGRNVQDPDAGPRPR